MLEARGIKAELQAEPQHSPLRKRDSQEGLLEGHEVGGVVVRAVLFNLKFVLSSTFEFVTLLPLASPQVPRAMGAPLASGPSLRHHRQSGPQSEGYHRGIWRVAWP